jgi:hypothetical protein
VDLTVDLLQSLEGLSFTSQTPIFIQHTKNNPKRGPFGAHNLFLDIMSKKRVGTIVTKFIATSEYGGTILYQNQKPVKAENIQDYLVSVLIESQLFSDSTATTYRPMQLLKQQSQDNFSNEGAARSTRQDGKSTSTRGGGSSSSAQRSSNTGFKRNPPTSDTKRNVFARRSAEPSKLLYLDERTLNAISLVEEYEFIDEEQEPETLNKLMGLHDSPPRSKSLHSFAGADRSTKGDKQKPVCLTLLHFGGCKFGDSCSYNHDRSAILAGREQAEKLWAADIQLNHLSYHWTAVSAKDQSASATDLTYSESSESEDAQDTEEVPHSGWGDFIGGQDSE